MPEPTCTVLTYENPNVNLTGPFTFERELSMDELAKWEADLDYTPCGRPGNPCEKHQKMLDSLKPRAS